MSRSDEDKSNENGRDKERKFEEESCKLNNKVFVECCLKSRGAADGEEDVGTQKPEAENITTDARCLERKSKGGGKEEEEV